MKKNYIAPDAIELVLESEDFALSAPEKDHVDFKVRGKTERTVHGWNYYDEWIADEEDPSDGGLAKPLQ